MFCPQPDEADPSSLYLMMNQALAAKHARQSNQNPVAPIDIILKLEEPYSTEDELILATYKEYVFWDEVEENMKRTYLEKEYSAKINMLS